MRLSQIVVTFWIQNYTEWNVLTDAKYCGNIVWTPWISDEDLLQVKHWTERDENEIYKMGSHRFLSQQKPMIWKQTMLSHR